MTGQNAVGSYDSTSTTSMSRARSAMQQDTAPGRTDDSSSAQSCAADLTSSTDRLAGQRTTTERIVADIDQAQRAAGLGPTNAAESGLQRQTSSSDSPADNTDPAPSGLAVTGHTIGQTGYQSLVDNPRLTVRYEATQPAWKGTGGFNPDARGQLESQGIEVARQVNPVPVGSISQTPGITPQSVTTHNGQLAEQAIADRYSQIPLARVDQQYRYDANLRPVSDARQDLPGDRKVDVRVEIDHPSDPRLREVIEVESKATTRITPSKLNTAQIDHDVARLSRNNAMRAAGTTLETVGKYARPVGMVLDAVDVVGAFRADGNSVGMNTGETVSGLVGGSAGGWAGATAGAALGTAIMPGVGTVVGGLVGAAFGAWGGDQAGRGVFGTVAGWFG